MDATSADIGLMIPPWASIDAILRLARRADELGYSSITASHIAARDSFSLLAAIAVQTRRAQLSTAVAPIYPRSPASMAQAAATVDELSGGRYRLGLGVGHRSTMGPWHGQEIGKPVTEMREYLGAVRALLTGEPVPEGHRWSTTFAFTGFTPRPDIPIVLAALSPAMLKLAAEAADGIVLWACPANYIHEVVVPTVAAARAAAGKTLAGFTITAAMPTAVGGDESVMLDAVRTELHRYFGLPFYRAMFAAAGFDKELAEFDAATDLESRKQAISAAFIAELCALGDGSAVRDGIERYRRAGATEILLSAPPGTDLEPALEAAAGAPGAPAAATR
ncbi:LLM class flavin-dependent oxidoreductase [Nocardia sp. NPDC088792]|uniref:LLM class flavin-dependent oxidoreductase n=1 Tax=Nocardia sp. NPDC088792 TaxID=3364332 RepID=UPI003819B5FE